VDRINAGYKLLDRASATFNYPISSSQTDKSFLLPNSSRTFQPMIVLGVCANFSGSIRRNNDIYGNLLYPLEHALVESFVAAAIDDDDDDDDDDRNGTPSWENYCGLGFNDGGLLDVNNDILDRCPDKRRVEWFSVNFGRERTKVGPFDDAISNNASAQKRNAGMI